jgi:hypothetical protein
MALITTFLDSGPLLPVSGPHRPSYDYALYRGLEFSSHDHGATFVSVAVFDEACNTRDYECEIGEMPRFNLADLDSHWTELQSICDCQGVLQRSCDYGNITLRASGERARVYLGPFGHRASSERTAVYYRGKQIALPISKQGLEDTWGPPDSIRTD